MEWCGAAGELTVLPGMQHILQPHQPGIWQCDSEAPTGREPIKHRCQLMRTSTQDPLMRCRSAARASIGFSEGSGRLCPTSTTGMAYFAVIDCPRNRPRYEGVLWTTRCEQSTEPVPDGQLPSTWPKRPSSDFTQAAPRTQTTSTSVRHICGSCASVIDPATHASILDAWHNRTNLRMAFRST